MIREQARSGETAAAFCWERGVRRGQFFAWKKRLRNAQAPELVAVKIAAEAPRPEPVASGTIEVRLGDGRSLMVKPGFDAHHLRAVIAALAAEA